jgi:hypothetical protein
MAILADAKQAREHFDVLVNFSAEMVPALTKSGSPQRGTLLTAWNAALDQFAADASLSRADRLGAISAKLALAKLELPEGSKPKLGPALLAQVRDAASTADKTTSNTYERQAVIPSAADLLSEAGLLDESDTMLKTELPKAVSPYYHMLVLAANAKERGDKIGALDWTEQAWKASVGPATRLQWGTGYVKRLIELAPQDAARIEKAATGVLAELDPVPDTFYERNRRGLEKMGQGLLAWSTKGQHAAVIKRLALQLDDVCTKLPPEDDTRTACVGVFKARSGRQQL